MILVEGGLQSWGRAETALKILGIQDKDFELSDVFDAVRTSRGDMNSSLQYLEKTCEICYTEYPMSKVQSYLYKAGLRLHDL